MKEYNGSTYETDYINWEMQIRGKAINLLNKNHITNKKYLFTFRDAKHHVGDAHIVEIEDGFYDGEKFISKMMMLGFKLKGS